MTDVGGRLKEERSRLKYNQESFGELCGVKRRTQLSYEKSESAPDSHYLTKAHALGVDVNYVLIGQRVRKLVTDIDEQDEQQLDVSLYQFNNDEAAGQRGRERGTEYNKELRNLRTKVRNELITQNEDDIQKIETALTMVWEHKNYTSKHVNDVISVINTLSKSAATVERDEQLLRTGMKLIMDEIERANIDLNENVLNMMTKTYVTYRNVAGMDVKIMLRAVAESQAE